MDDTEDRVLTKQLSELLRRPPEDLDGALELAVVAGLGLRAGAAKDLMQRAAAWRDGLGSMLVRQLWEQLDLEEILERLEEVAEVASTPEELEEALLDCDEVIAGAIWCRSRETVRGFASAVADLVGNDPEVFAPVADLAEDVLALPAVQEDIELYAFWQHLSGI